MAGVHKIKDAFSHRIKSMRGTLDHYGIHIPCWVHLLIWAIALAVLIGLTLNDILPLVSDYRNDNTNVAIKTRLITNGTFAPPTLILAIPQFKTLKTEANAARRISRHLSNGTVDECEDCELLANVSWDVWRDMNISVMKANNVNIHVQVVLALMRKMIESFQSGVDVLDDQYSHLNRPLMDACLIFLSWHWNIDAGYSDPDDGDAMSTLDLYQSDRRWNGTRLFDFLGNRCMKAICDETAMTVKISGGAEYTCRQLMTQDSMPIIMTTDYIWVPIPCRSIEECDASLYFVYVKNDSSSMWVSPANYTGVKKIWLNTDASSQYRSDFDSPMHVSSNLYSETAGLTAPWLTVVYSMAMATVESRDHLKDKCYKDSNLNLCLNKCSKLWIMKHCGCIPFTYRKGIDWPDPSLPYCTHRHYNVCDPLAHRKAKDEYCAKQCMYSCKYNSYNWHVYRDELYTKPDPYGYHFERFIATFRPRITPFLEFSLTSKDTPQTFASQIGGILGLYLGLSGLSAFIFIVTCVKFAQTLSRRKRHQETSDKMRMISLWQMLLLSKGTNQNQPQNDGQQTLPSQRQSDADDDNSSTLKPELAKIYSIVREQEEKVQAKLDEMGKEKERFENTVNSKLLELEAKIPCDIKLEISPHNLHNNIN